MHVDGNSHRHQSLQVAAKKLDRRLQALGAAALLERGLGDDQVRARQRQAMHVMCVSMQHQQQAAGAATGSMQQLHMFITPNATACCCISTRLDMKLPWTPGCSSCGQRWQSSARSQTACSRCAHFCCLIAAMQPAPVHVRAGVRTLTLPACVPAVWHACCCCCSRCWMRRPCCS